MDYPELINKELICIDCNKPFIFDEGEQRYFLSKGLSEPKRCKCCRKARKDSLNISRGGNSNGRY